MVTILNTIDLKSKIGDWSASTNPLRDMGMNQIFNYLLREIDYDSKNKINQVVNHAFELEEESKIQETALLRKMPSRICKKKSLLSTKRKARNSISAKNLSWTSVNVDLKEQFDTLKSNAFSMIQYTPEEIKEKKSRNIIWLKKQMNPDANSLTTTIEEVFDDSSNNDYQLPNGHVDLSGRPESYNDPARPEGLYGFGFEVVRVKKPAASNRQHQKTPRTKRHQVLSNPVEPFLKTENDELTLLYAAERSDAIIGNMEVHKRVHEFPFINPCDICGFQFTSPSEKYFHLCNFSLSYFM